MGYMSSRGLSKTFTPGAWESMIRASLAVIFFSVSIFTDSAWQKNTGTRAQVAVTLIEGSSKIFTVSLTIFISSLV